MAAGNQVVVIKVEGNNSKPLQSKMTHLQTSQILTQHPWMMIFPFNVYHG
jgi:hypothetical protein